MQKGRSRWGFRNCLHLYDADARSNGLLLFGHWRDPTLARLEFLGLRTPRQVDALRGLVAHECVEIHSAIDADEPASYETWKLALAPIRARFRLSTQSYDNERGFGRTIYLGAPSSRVRALLYERGLKRDVAHLHKPNWTRLELRVRPKDRPTREEFSRLDALGVWGVSPWTRMIAGLFGEPDLARQRQRVEWRKTPLDEKLDNMLHSYSKPLEALANRVGWDGVGKWLLHRLNLLRKG